jgi:CheY-like chemotaxis protein
MAKEILIADSDKLDQKEFQRIFEATDYHLIFSESGEDALLRAKLFKPDMIIASGAGLHEKGGLELCGAIKGDPDFKHIPFILISSIFDEVSEKDRKQFRADGVISKPLNEAEVLDLVDNLMEGGAAGKRDEMVSDKEESLFDEMGEGEEEIIELVDVVEEPEPRMSIDSFVPTGREKSFGEVTSLDSWGKLEFEQKPVERDLGLRPEKKTAGMDLRVKRKVPLKEAAPEEELFDKIELEEILEKVEQLKPSLEKEWPSGKEVRDIDERPFEMEEPAEKLDLSEFEKALRREAKAAAPQEEPQPFFMEEAEKKISEEARSIEELVEKPLRKPLRVPVEEPLEKPLEKSFKPLGESLEESLEAPQEEFLEAPLEEAEEVALEKPAEELLGEPAAVEEIGELTEEEFPEEFLEDILEKEETGAVGEQEELKAEELTLEDLKIEEIEEVEEIEEIEETEKMEEMGGLEEIGETERIDQIEEMEQVEETGEIKWDRLEEVVPTKTIRAEAPKAARLEAPKIPREEVPSLVRAVDKQVQEIISQKVQEMMGEMMTKLVPEMTQNVVSFALERIEKVVKEVVPDLAEKAIQEEIKRLEKGEKG